jgi:hypothetical protein
MAMEGLVVMNIGDSEECKDNLKNKRSWNHL